MRQLGQVIVILGVWAVSACGLAACQQASDIETVTPTIPAQEQTQVPSAAFAAEPPTIVFLGDSLTAGFNLSPKDALPEQVGLRLTEKGQSVEVINAGVSGDTSANGLARYDWSVKSVNPDFLIVALGANDYLQNIPPATTKTNLSEILTRAKVDKISVILVGLEQRSKAETGSRDANFEAIYPELASQFNVPLYPALMEAIRNKPDLLQSDGLHPTAKGVEVMADGLTEFLEPLIK